MKSQKIALVLFCLSSTIGPFAVADGRVDLNCAAINDAKTTFTLDTDILGESWNVGIKIPQKSYAYQSELVNDPKQGGDVLKANADYIETQDFKNKVYTLQLQGKNDQSASLTFYAIPRTLTTVNMARGGLKLKFQAHLQIWGDSILNPKTGKSESPDFMMNCTGSNTYD
jgi:hypothetical protein